MAGINISDFKTTKSDKWGDAFGLIGLVPDTDAYELVTDEYTIAIGYTLEWSDGGSWVCQIDDADGGNIACWDGETVERALENALVQCCEHDALRDNDNCEDAVNQMAYEAFAMACGEQMPDTSEQFEQLDRLMGMATRLVKRDGETHGIEWVEYQSCEA